MTDNGEASGMSETRTMVRTQVTVDDVRFLLAQGQDLDALKGAIEAAVRSGPRFVEFIVVGNRSVSVLMSEGTKVVISVDTVEFDHRDNGDDSAPFGGAYDLL
ncbi:hypothetical protein [Microbacterium sp. SA39]|uniref:hypothetical protein n=1 Tax=Microbacterium sp. SA39 TaxID=1263625 RepID=UPI0005FA3F7E|nr:hypothetical protein [Microbacterium sp. SA39]